MKKYTDFIQAGISVPLTRLAAGYTPHGLISEQVFPTVLHPVSSGMAPIFDKGAFKIHDTTRAPGAATNKIKMEIGDWTPFLCVEHDLAIPLDKRELDEILRLPTVETGIFNLQNRARNRAQWNIALGKEKAVADRAQDGSFYTAGNINDLSAGGKIKWSAGGTPVTDIEAGKEVIRGLIGAYPTTLVLGASAYKTLKFHSDYTDKIKMTSDKVVLPGVIAQMHDLREVIIGQSMQSDKDGNLVDLWADVALLCYIPKSVEPALDEPAFGYTVRPMGTTPYPYVDVYPEEGGKIINVRCTDCYTQLVLMPHAGYLIKEVA